MTPTPEQPRGSGSTPSARSSEKISVYRANRARFPAEELRAHAGQWVAFSVDGCRLLASCPDYAGLEERLTRAGIDPQEVVLEHIPAEDTCFGGAELL